MNLNVTNVAMAKQSLANCSKTSANLNAHPHFAMKAALPHVVAAKREGIEHNHKLNVHA